MASAIAERVETRSLAMAGYHSLSFVAARPTSGSIAVSSNTLFPISTINSILMEVKKKVRVDTSIK